MTVTLNFPVGPGLQNKAADVVLVQLALSDITLAVPAKGGQGKRVLWQRSKVSAKYSAAVGAAISDYQKARGLKPTGKVEPGGQTFKKLVNEAKVLSQHESFPHATYSKLEFKKIELSTKRERTRILLKEPMPITDAKALGELVVAAAKQALEFRAVDTRVNRNTGYIEVQIKLFLGSEAASPVAKIIDVGVAEKSLGEMISKSYGWVPLNGKSFVNNTLWIRTGGGYSFLKIGSSKVSDDTLEEYFLGISTPITKESYRTDPVLRTFIDAAFGLMQIFDRTGDARLSQRKVLLQILHPKYPDAARKLRDRAVWPRIVGLADRQISPLYAFGFSFSIIRGVGIGFGLNLLMDPNTRKEYLLIEFSTGIGVDASAEAGLSTLEKSIVDFDAVNVKFSASAKLEVPIGPMVLSVTLKAERPTLNSPEWHDGLKLTDFLNLEDIGDKFQAGVEDVIEGAGKSKGSRQKTASRRKSRFKGPSPNVIFFKWDLGIIEIKLTGKTDPGFKAKREFLLKATTGFLVEFDFEDWDNLLYNILPSEQLSFERIQ